MARYRFKKNTLLGILRMIYLLYLRDIWIFFMFVWFSVIDK